LSLQGNQVFLIYFGDVFRTGLANINRYIVNQAQGKVAGQLLSFLGTESSKRDIISELLMRLRESGETELPSLVDALHRAAERGLAKELKILLDLHTKDLINATNDFNETALHIAVRANKVCCVGLLLQCGADKELLDAFGNRPLDLPMAKENPNIRDLLSPQTQNSDEAGFEDVGLKII